MLARAFTLLALSCSALASISITNPVASTSLAGGKSLKISWLADSDTVTPLAKSFGSSTVSLYTGSSTTQYRLETFGTLDPYKTKTISKVVPKTIGPSAALYFIRIESLAATDSAGNPLEAFSARFTMTGMTGKWTTEQAAANSAVSVASTAASATSTKKASATGKSSSARSATKAVNANAASSTTTVVAVVTASANSTQNTASSGAAALGVAALGWKVAAGLSGVAGAMMLL